MGQYRYEIGDLILLLDGKSLELEWYGCDSDGDYFKARHPRGGTIEVHVLNESHFEGHPSAWEEE